MSVKYNKDHYSIVVENPFDNTINIEVSGFEYSGINLDMDNDDDRRALHDIAAYINSMLYQRMQKHFEILRFEKPGRNAITVGDLAGLKRED